MFRLTWHNLLARKVRLVMSTLAIVLGIGFLAGVLTFSAGLSATFDGIIKGSTPDGLVRAAGTESFEAMGAGNTSTLTPAQVDEVAALPEVDRADGNVDGFGMYVLDEDDKLVGGTGAPTLAFNYNDTPNLLGEPTLALDGGRWPTAPGEIALDTRSADNAGYEVGDTVTVIPPTASLEGELTAELELVGLASFNGGGTAGSTLVVFDTAGAQEMFLAGQDRFTSISLTAAEGVTQAELVEAVQAVLPAEFEAVTGDTVVEESESAIGEFLTIITSFLVTFAVIAIVVGGFIIANTFSILVAQRVRELALLRALGASRKQVTRSVLAEAALMAVLGSTLGILVGLGLARGLAALFRFVGLDINADALDLTVTTVLAAYGVGLLVTVLSAYVPARRAAKVAPVAAMREDEPMQEGSLHRRTLVGVVVLLLGAGLAAVGVMGAPGNDAIWIGAAAVVWVLTFAFISPVVGRPVLTACRSLFGRVFGTSGRLAGDNAIRNPRRTGATASALMIGLTLVSAVGVLAASMRASTDRLVEEQFASDFLVQSASFGSFPTALGDAMAQVPGVGLVSRQQAAMATVDDEAEPTFVIGTDEAFPQIYDLPMVAGTLAMSGDQAVVNEAVADDKGLEVGSTFTLSFPGDKSADLEVVGIMEDTPVAGGVNVPLGVLEGAGVKRVDNTLSINVAEGSSPAEVQAGLEELVEPLPIVSVQDKDEFAEGIRGQVNQLLYMIYGLLALSVVIAVIGIVNTLSLSVYERTREIGLLRAVGLSRRRLRRMVTLESVTISLMGAVLGLGLGVTIGLLLQWVLREDLTERAVPLGSLAVFLGIAVLFGVLAAVVPAVRASRMKVLEAIATE